MRISPPVQFRAQIGPLLQAALNEAESAKSAITQAIQQLPEYQQNPTLFKTIQAGNNVIEICADKPTELTQLLLDKNIIKNNGADRPPTFQDPQTNAGFEVHIIEDLYQVTCQ